MRLQDVIARGLAADKPAANTVAPGTLYYSSDTHITERSNGTIWETYADTGGGSSTPHHATHEAGGTDQIKLDDLAAPDDNTDLNVSITKHGLAPKLPNDATKFLDGTGNYAVPPTGTPGAHASTHKSGGSDPIKLDELAAPTNVTTLNSTASAHGLMPRLSNVTAEFLNGVGGWAVPAGATRFASIQLVIDGGASVITTGLKGFLEIPFSCLIQQVTLLADVSGSIVFDIWKDSYTNYPPTVADTITGSAKPTISSAIKSQNSSLTGWSTLVIAGDILGFNVDSVTTIKRVTLSLRVQII